MAKDDRLYAKFTLDFPDHAKIMPLSDAAFRCLTEAILWSRKHKTDGLLPRRYAVARWSLEVLRELCGNDPEKPSLIESEEGWRIHDFTDIQDTRAEIEARRERNRVAGKQGGLAKAKRSAKQVASESLSENLPETETETERTTEVVTSVGASSVANAPKGADGRGAYIPADWTPNESTRQWARDNYGHLDLRHELEQFRSYWLAASGQNARKRDWNQAFRNWLGKHNPGAVPRNGAPAKPHKLRVLADLAAKARDMELAQAANSGKAVEA